MNENAMELVEMDDVVEETMEMDYEPITDEFDSNSTEPEDNTGVDLGVIALLAAGAAGGAILVTQGPKVVKKAGEVAGSAIGFVGNKFKSVFPGKKKNITIPVETVDDETEEEVE